VGFAPGYTSMAQRIPNAGAFYSYIASGLGRVPGVASAFVAVASYNAMQIGLYGGLGVVGADVIHQVFGVTVPWWVVALIGWALIGAMGVFRVDFNAQVLGFLLGIEIVVIVVFDAVMLYHRHSGHLSFTAMNPHSLLVGGAGVALVIALTGVVGFEDPPNYIEEARNPRQAGWAVYVSLLVTTVLYAGSSWAMTVDAGPGNVVAGSAKYGTEFMFHLVGPYVPQMLLDVGHLLFITSLFAAGLSFHNTCARYFFALGREKVLPHGLGRTWATTGSPAFGSVLQSVIAVIVLILIAVTGADPQVVLFFDGTVAAGFGVMVLMTACCAAVIAYYARNRGVETVWRAYLSPALGLAGLAATLWVSIVHFGTLMGVPDDSTLARVLPAIVAVLAVAGAVWALILRRTKPDVYDGIGLGGDLTARRLSKPAASSGGTTDAVVLEDA
jgi:amino acid transporter